MGKVFAGVGVAAYGMAMFVAGGMFILYGLSLDRERGHGHIDAIADAVDEVRKAKEA